MSVVENRERVRDLDLEMVTSESTLAIPKGKYQCMAGLQFNRFGFKRESLKDRV